MLNTLKKYIDQRILIICLFILITGISAGIFSGALLPPSDKTHLLSILSNSSETSIIPGIFTNSAIIALIGLSGFTIYGFPLALVLLLFRGFAFGFCDYLLLCSSEYSNLIHFLFSFLMPQLLLSFIYMFTSTIATGYAVSRLHY